MGNPKNTIHASVIQSERLKYRSRFDIVGEMLQAAVRGATKTRLMYEAFLSHNQVEEYLDFLLGKKLIFLAEDKKHYLPTEKGLRFLEMYAEFKDAVTIQVAQQVAKPQPEPAGGRGLNESAKPLEPARVAQRPGPSLTQPQVRKQLHASGQ
jgi:predicted transcriptional regulator